MMKSAIVMMLWTIGIWWVYVNPGGGIEAAGAQGGSQNDHPLMLSSLLGGSHCITMFTKFYTHTSGVDALVLASISLITGWRNCAWLYFLLSLRTFRRCVDVDWRSLGRVIWATGRRRYWAEFKDDHIGNVHRRVKKIPGRVFWGSSRGGK